MRGFKLWLMRYREVASQHLPSLKVEHRLMARHRCASQVLGQQLSTQAHVQQLSHNLPPIRITTIDSKKMRAVASKSKMPNRVN